MYLVTLFEKLLGHVRAILAGDTGNEGPLRFGHAIPPLVRTWDGSLPASD